MTTPPIMLSTLLALATTVASPALADGRMVIGCDSGLVYCFDLNPAKK